MRKYAPGNLMIRNFLIVMLFILLAVPSMAEEEKAPAAPKPEMKPREFVTHHNAQIGKDVLNYTAVAGETILEDKAGTQKAAIFSISYIKEGSEHPESRPITFLFNGGPGSSAVWLHLGAFGPRRIALPENPVNPGAPPYRLEDNPRTLLRFTDLVFVDPVGTGYSRALGGKADKDYWGVDEDAEILSDFIRAYITKNKRWNSPKYLGGESYGTLRASVLIRDLQLKLLDSVQFNGVILISNATDVRTFVNAGPGNELPYITDLPTFAATAHYHNALPQQPEDLNSFLREVEQFAGNEYVAALFKGDSLPEDQQNSIAEKLHRYTGLSAEYIKRAHNRIDRDRFLKELLRSRGQTVAVHDTRFLGKDPDDVGEAVETDPFLFGVTGPFVTMINNYLLEELNVKIDQPYVVFSLEANRSWKRASGSDHAFAGYLNTTSYFAQAAATNKDFRLFVASGLHDLTTTYFGSEYVFRHSGIDKSRLTLKTYFGGHMMYLHPASLEQLSTDIGVFSAISPHTKCRGGAIPAKEQTHHSQRLL